MLQFLFDFHVFRLYMCDFSQIIFRSCRINFFLVNEKHSDIDKAKNLRIGRKLYVNHSST